jgi:hypothetical protein
MTEQIERGWYLVTKYYRGGMTTYALKVTKEIQGRFDDDMEELQLYIGDNTDGGTENGWTVKTEYQATKPKADKELVMQTVTYRLMQTVTCRRLLVKEAK